MTYAKSRTMRDALIERICDQMAEDEKIFFISADMGAPALDKLRARFADRFINVGVAEQNLINVATGLALEGYTVYALGIAAFLSMRCYEQIRINLALSSQHRQINVNLIAVGCGVSYDMSGPTHHCLEDICLIRTLPNIHLLCPSDWVSAAQAAEYCKRQKAPKYIRLESKALPNIYSPDCQSIWTEGLGQLRSGRDICIVSTGYPTHLALRVADKIAAEGIDMGVVDLLLLKPAAEDKIYALLRQYKTVLTLEEAFTGKGGLDCLVGNIIKANDADIAVKSFGFGDSYCFRSADRDALYNLNQCGEEHLTAVIRESAGL